MLRWLEQFGNAEGFINIIDEDVHAAFGLDVLHAVIRLTGFDVGSSVHSRYAINAISRMHDALGSGYAWPYVNAEMLLLLSAHRVILDSSAQAAINVGGGFVIVGGLLIGLPALASWLASPAAVGVTGGAGTVAGVYLERIKAFVGIGGDRVVSQTAISVTEKLQRYLLNPSHPEGKHKAELFRQALGYTQANMARLAEQIVFNPATARAIELTQHGQKFVQYINITGANGRIVEVKTVWIRNLDGVIRLITAYPS